MKNAEKQGKADALRKLIKVSNAMRRVGIDMRPVFFKSIIAAFGGNLNLIISGGAPIDQKYVKGFDDIGINIMNGYGITECSPIVSTSRNKATKPGSVGLAVPGTTVKVDNPDENGEGELLGGVRAVHSKFVGVLEKDGVEVIDPTGEAFDALEAQAGATVPDTEAFDETVHEVYQKGYRLGAKVIRPAMVTVTTGGPKRPKPEEDETEE